MKKSVIAHVLHIFNTTFDDKRYFITFSNFENRNTFMQIGEKFSGFKVMLEASEDIIFRVRFLDDQFPANYHYLKLLATFIEETEKYLKGE